MNSTTLKIQQKEHSKKLASSSYLLLFILAIGFSFNTTGQVLKKDITYIIESKTSRKVLDVKWGRDEPGTQIWQYDLTFSKAQQFAFDSIHVGTDVVYYIGTEHSQFITLKLNLVETTARSQSTDSSMSPYVLIQDKKYIKTPQSGISLNAPDPNLQRWKLIRAGTDGVTYFIQSVAFPGKVLQPFNNNSQSGISLVSKTGAENQQWTIYESEGDLSNVPKATQSEIEEFDNITENQMGVGVLGGETTNPFHYYTQDGEVYKYKKHTDFGDIECWFPVDEYRHVLCGKVMDYHLCTQDAMHDGSYGNLDIDGNLDIIPNSKFAFMSKNPRLESYISNYYFQRVGFWMFGTYGNWRTYEEAKELAIKDSIAYRKKYCKDRIECEFQPPMKNKTPKDPFLNFTPDGGLNKRRGKDICVYGPWMWDRIVDKVWLNLATNLGLADGDQNNNEIHPVNQMWFKEGNEIQLISIVDGSGLFDFRKGYEYASGGDQKMRYYIAFEIPLNKLNSTQNSAYKEYHVNGLKYLQPIAQPTTVPKTNTITLKYKGKTRLEIHDNSFVKLDYTHSVTFEKIRTRDDGSIQGYIVVETIAMYPPGGSIDIFVKEVVH